MTGNPLFPINASAATSSTPHSGNSILPGPAANHEPGERSATSPLGPPPLIHDKSPYCPVPLPPQVSGVTEVALNPLLLPTPNPEVQVDFSLSFGTDGIPQDRLSEPATEPQLPSLTVIYPDLPWAITVHPSSVDSNCVTVADVLQTIHRSLSLPLAEYEYHVSLSGPNNRRGTRSGRHRQDKNIEALWTGMTRLSFLAGKTRFVGLGPSSLGSDVWVLQVGIAA